MTWPAVKFVDSPATTATVRLDMSSQSVQVRRDGFDLGVPSFDGAPESVGVEYGYRNMSFDVMVTGTKATALATMQTLARELLRRSNWLLFQLQATSAPVWFKTFRSQPGELSLSDVYDETSGAKIPDQWRITVPLAAEGFSYGARVTHATVTVNNNPAAGSNPSFLQIPAIKGDAPAPLRIAADFSANLDQYDILWAVTPVPASYTAPIVWQIGTGDGLAAGTDLGAAVTDANYSGGSYRAVSFATNAALIARFTATAPASIPPGRYKMLLRVARSDTNSTFAFRFGYWDGILGAVGTNGSPTVTMDRSASAAAGHATWVSLGDFSVPRFQNDLNLPGSAPPLQYLLQAQRLSGTGAAHLDAILLIPLELRDMDDSGRLLISRFPGFGPASADLSSYWDGDAEAFTRINSSSQVDTSSQPELAGQFPLAFPGQTNVLHMVLQTRTGSGNLGTTNNSDSIAASAVVELSYHPRYLNLRAD